MYIYLCSYVYTSFTANRSQRYCLYKFLNIQSSSGIHPTSALPHGPNKIANAVAM
jgi:hypothetical protein